MVLKVIKVILQSIVAVISRMGFIKFEPSGVDAANKTSPTISPTTRQSASGPLVIKAVTVPIPFICLIDSMIISMDKPMSIMTTIMPDAPINES